MKILIEMTEQEYDEYRIYLEEKEIYVVDSDVVKLKEEERVEALKKVIKNAQVLEKMNLQPVKKMDEIENGSFKRVDGSPLGTEDIPIEEKVEKYIESRKDRKKKNIQAVLKVPAKMRELKEDLGIEVGE